MSAQTFWTVAVCARRSPTRKSPQRAGFGILRAHREAQSRAERLSHALTRTRVRAGRRIDAAVSRARLCRAGGRSIAVKDVISTTGVRTTCGSKSSRRMCRRMTPQRRAAGTRGAVILGKTNCDEFAMGSSNENSAYGPCAIPWQPIASGRIERRVGRGGGGWTGRRVAGHRYGRLHPAAGFLLRHSRLMQLRRVSRYGLVAFASSLDKIGRSPRISRHGGGTGRDRGA